MKVKSSKNAAVNERKLVKVQIGCTVQFEQKYHWYAQYTLRMSAGHLILITKQQLYHNFTNSIKLNNCLIITGKKRDDEMWQKIQLLLVPNINNDIIIT